MGTSGPGSDDGGQDHREEGVPGIPQRLPLDHPNPGDHDRCNDRDDCRLGDVLAEVPGNDEGECRQRGLGRTSPAPEGGRQSLAQQFLDSEVRARLARIGRQVSHGPG